MVGDHVTDHPSVFSTNQVRCDVVPDGDNEDQNDPGADPWQRLRHVDPKERKRRGGTKILCSAHITWWDCLHNAVNRQNHEGQQYLDHDDHRAGEVVHHRQPVLVRQQMRPNQSIIDYALLLQHHHPGHNSDQQ